MTENIVKGYVPVQIWTNVGCGLGQERVSMVSYKNSNSCMFIIEMPRSGVRRHKEYHTDIEVICLKQESFVFCNLFSWITSAIH